MSYAKISKDNECLYLTQDLSGLGTYDRAKAILEGRDENVEINFVNARDDKNWYEESEVRTQSGKSVINMLTQQELAIGQRLEPDMHQVQPDVCMSAT